ncbi:MAG: hypothetical protein HYX24_06205 [Candidatus Aenigmarchaeota archaeon]|nr:hypothetical protein [Candidatus Aenigmarchaeota archaeon]
MGSGNRSREMKGEEKGDNGFIYVLIAGVVVLAALFILGPMIQLPEDTGKVKAVHTFSVGKVGVSAGSFKSQTIGTFQVGETQKEVLKLLGRVEIENGIPGTKTQEYPIAIPDYLLESLKDIKVSFDIVETNQYGELIFEWNGKEVFRRKAASREWSFTIPRDNVGRLNTLKVHASSPGLIFWASTVYKLEPFEVSAEYGPSKLFGFQLSQKELETFSRGEIEFYSLSGAKLSVRINGRQIFSRPPEGTEKLIFDFSTAPVFFGQNVLSFESSSPVTIDGARLKLYVQAPATAFLERFNLTKANINSMKNNKGRVKVAVSSVDRPGSLAVMLNGKTIGSETVLEVASPTYKFDGADAREGMNEIQITGTGEFEIGQAVVGVEG